MNKKLFEETLDMLVDAWGIESEMRMAIEEMSELTKELCKFIRYSHNDQSPENDAQLEKIKTNMTEETADVLNCMLQLKKILGKEEVEKVQDLKMQRTRAAVEKWLEEHKNMREENE